MGVVSACLFLCGCKCECVFAQPAQLVAGGREVPACVEESWKEWIDGVGVEEEGVGEAGHVEGERSGGWRIVRGRWGGLGVQPCGSVLAAILPDRLLE